MLNRFKEFVNRFNSLFSIPFLVCFLISLVSVKYTETKIADVLNLLLAIISVLYLGLLIFILCKKLMKNQILIWTLVLSLIFLILSYTLSITKETNASNLLFIIGIMLFESYILCEIISSCYSEKPNINKTVLLSLIFICVGFYSIYLCSYHMKDKTIFNALITMFSAIVGGSVTLAGVAWTVRDNERSRRQDFNDREISRKLEYKPYFYGKRLAEVDVRSWKHSIFINDGTKSFCRDKLLVTNINDDDEEVIYIESIFCVNTDHSNFIIEKVELMGECFEKYELIYKNDNFLLGIDKYFIKKKTEECKLKLYTKDLIGNKYVFNFELETYTTRNEDLIKKQISCNYLRLKNIYETNSIK